MPPVSFTVVIPCRDRSALLLRALRSCLAQRLPPQEVIVIDDAGEEDLGTAILPLRALFSAASIDLRVLRLQHNRGPAAARNAGWERAHGEYIAFLDSDDVWHPDKLAIVGATLADSRGLGAFHGSALWQDVQTTPPPLSPADFSAHPVGPLRGLLRNFAPTPCVVVKRSIPERFDESMRHLEDHDLWVRIAHHGPLLKLVGPPLAWLGREPMSPGGLSAQRWKMRLGELRMYRKFCRGPWLIVWPLLAAWSLCKHACRAVLDRRATTDA